MPRTLVLDTFPLSSVGKQAPGPAAPLTVSEQCHRWIRACLVAGNPILSPAIAYYEVLREMERIQATTQIRRIQQFCAAAPRRFLSITDAHLEVAAHLWATARNAGYPTASPDALDVDVILAAQALSLNLSTTDYVIATTNAGHLSLFVPAEHWQTIPPGS